MIDFVKCLIFDSTLIEYFRTHPLLEWVSSEDRFNKYDAEVIRTKMVRSYDGFVFVFRGDRLEIQLMPHYRFNNHQHNANDFSMADCIKQITEFRNIFGVDLFYFPIVNLEYGLNVLSPIDVRNFITFLYAHCRNEFKNDLDLQYSRRSYHADKYGKANEYKSIKAYAKALQKGNPCHPDTFRLEVNSKMRKFISTLGIDTLADLLNPAVYSNLVESIIVEFDNILLIDTTVDMMRFTTEEQKQIEGYLNPLKWHDILRGHRNLFSIEKKKYYSLLDKTGKHLKLRMAEQIQAKLYELTQKSNMKMQIPL